MDWKVQHELYIAQHTSEWRKDLSARHSETINSTRHLIAADPWLPRPDGGADVEGWCASWWTCPCTYIWICVCMTQSHIPMNSYVCAYSPHECITLCVCRQQCRPHTHTHLSRRVRFLLLMAPWGPWDISILKGDISQSEPCSGVHSPITLTVWQPHRQAGRRTHHTVERNTRGKRGKWQDWVRKTPVQHPESQTQRELRKRPHQ